MRRLTPAVLLLAVTATSWHQACAIEPQAGAARDTKYLVFQVWPCECQKAGLLAGSIREAVASNPE